MCDAPLVCFLWFFMYVFVLVKSVSFLTGLTDICPVLLCPSLWFFNYYKGRVWTRVLGIYAFELQITIATAILFVRWYLVIFPGGKLGTGSYWGFVISFLLQLPLLSTTFKILSRTALRRRTWSIIPRNDTMSTIRIQHILVQLLSYQCLQRIRWSLLMALLASRTPLQLLSWFLTWQFLLTVLTGFLVICPVGITRDVEEIIWVCLRMCIRLDLRKNIIPRFIATLL